jgi:hypothetical protein
MIARLGPLIACGIIVAGAEVHPLEAQQRAEPADSVLRELRRLKARVDSLERIIQRLAREGQDTAAARDELAALRAAARRAAAERPPASDSVGGQDSRTRNLSILNPEISVTGDFVGNFVAPAGESSNVTAVPREFEFSFQSALDPYTRTKIFVTREEDVAIAGFAEDDPEGEAHGGFAIEEGYLYWVGLPGRLGVKVGKFRQEIGLYNRWHTHALMEVDRPLAAVTFLGEDGLIQAGASVTFPSLRLGPSTQTATFELARGDNEALFADGNELSYLGRIQSFWEVGGGNSFVQFGATGVVGENDDALLDSRLLGIDVAFRWTPAGRALYRELLLKSEWYFAEQEVNGVTESGHGGYAQASFRLNRRWIAGVRADYVEGYGTDTGILQLAPSLSWWQSEWVRLRLQYNFVRPEGGESNHTLLLQAVWAIGPHKHETY